HNVASVSVMAAALIAAGGKIVQGSGVSDYSVVLPPYQQGGNNSYVVNAVATDVKGNTSKEATTTVTVNAPQFDNANSTFTPPETTLPADNVSAQTLTLSLKTMQGTAYDVPVSDITLNVTGKNTAKVDPSFKRVDAGVYQITVTAGTTPETLILTPSVDGKNISSAKVQFVPDASTARVTDVVLVGTETSKVANGVNFFEFQAIVHDEQGNLVPDAVVEWAQDKGSDVVLSATTRTASGVTSKTNSQGIAVIRLTSTTKAVANIKVSANVLNDTNVVSAQLVSFVPDATTAKLVVELKDTSVTSKVANGTNAFDYVATVKDGNGNAMSGVVVNWSKAPDNDATLSATTSTTDASGIATITLTSTTKAVADIAVTGKVTTPFTASDDATKVSFVPDATTATLVVELKDTSVTSKVANGTNAFDYVATVKDGNGNAMSGVVVNWSKAPDNDATLSATTSTTDASGIATITLTSTKKAVADIAVTGKVSTPFTASDDATKVSFVPDATTATLVVELKDTSVTSKVANGTNAFDYVATVKDGNGNAMSGVVVNWSKSPDNDATLSATTSTTDASGIATITLTSTTKAVADIVVTGKVTTPFTDSDDATKVSFVPDATTATLVVELKDTSVTSKVANGTNAFDYVATVKDGNGNAMSDITVNWSKAPDNDATLSATTSTTDASGVATITLTSTTKAVADVVVTGAVSTLFTASDDATKVSFVGDVSTAKIKSVTLVGAEKRAIANGRDSFEYTATIEDANGNPLTDSNVVINWRTSDVNAKLSTTQSETDSTGTALITLTATSAAAHDVLVSAAVYGDNLYTSADSHISFVTLNFDLTPKDMVVVDGSRVQYFLKAYPSDGSLSISVNDDIEWAASNPDIVNIDEEGMAKVATGSVTSSDVIISATGKYRSIDFDETTLLKVRPRLIAGPYGKKNPDDGSEQEFLIGPPNYNIYIRSRGVVDAIGTDEGSSAGGTGGQPMIIPLKNLAKIKVLSGIWQDDPGKYRIINITFYNLDGTQVSCGEGTSQATNYTDVTTSEYTVPSGYKLSGIRAIDSKGSPTGLYPNQYFVSVVSFVFSLTQ
ncbi:Ig-like domain-containing protein, partial [Bartonella sp. LJL80]